MGKLKVYDPGKEVIKYNFKPNQKVKLFGDKEIQIESFGHEITFPGGCIYVMRCDDGKYWAHIRVNHKKHSSFVVDSNQGLEKTKEGFIENVRFDNCTSWPTELQNRLESDLKDCYHFAVLIGTK